MGTTVFTIYRHKTALWACTLHCMCLCYGCTCTCCTQRMHAPCKTNADEGAGTWSEPYSVQVAGQPVSVLHTSLSKHSQKVSDHSSIPVPFRYERRYIERWLAQGNLRCPATGQSMARPISLTRNVTLRKSIEEWAEKNATWMLVSTLLLCICRWLCIIFALQAALRQVISARRHNIPSVGFSLQWAVGSHCLELVSSSVPQTCLARCALHLIQMMQLCIVIYHINSCLYAHK